MGKHPPQRCPHGKAKGGYYCVKCKGKGICSHGHAAHECKLCNPGYFCAKHGGRKSHCPHGGPDSSCGKDLCRRHGLQVRKGICSGCVGKTRAGVGGWNKVSPGHFDIAPWEESPPVYDGKPTPAGKLKPAKLALPEAEGSVEPAVVSPEGV